MGNICCAGHRDHDTGPTLHLEEWIANKDAERHSYTMEGLVASPKVEPCSDSKVRRRTDRDEPAVRYPSPQAENLCSAQDVRGESAAAEMLDSLDCIFKTKFAIEQKTADEELGTPDDKTLTDALNAGARFKKDGLVEWHKNNIHEALLLWREGCEALHNLKASQEFRHSHAGLSELHGALMRNRAQAAIKLMYWKEALDAANDALRITEQDHKAWYRKACALEGLGQIDGVRDCLHRIEKLALGRPDRRQLLKDTEAKRAKIEAVLGPVGTTLRDEAGIGVSGLVDGGMVQANLSPFPLVISGIYEFAILTRSGSVVTGGDMLGGGDGKRVMEELRSGVQHVCSTCRAFAALRSNGSVVTWGHEVYGGNSIEVKDMLMNGVLRVSATRVAFAALKSNGSVVTWGDKNRGGDSVAVREELLSGVQHVYSNAQAFAAVKTDGSLVTWGSEHYGGNSFDVRDQLQSGVVQVFSNKMAFAALKSSGSVVTWGDKLCGGDSTVVERDLVSNVQHIFSNSVAFAALDSGGSVVTWGLNSCGGNSADVKDQLQSGVLRVYSTVQAFAALKDDGSVVTWGRDDCGGDSSVVKKDLQSDVKHVYSTLLSFAALKTNGSVVTWGDEHGGGDISDVGCHLESGLLRMYSTCHAFAALKANGSVVSWGAPDFGGDSTDVKEHLQSGVQQVYTICNDTFAAFGANGFFVTWGRKAHHVKDSLEWCR